ncbi:MAG: LptE family protein [Candidatus Omnitrophica bacterium]|nr:LptE family protein [Candidatus Omnitrophota bacterium]
MKTFIAGFLFMAVASSGCGYTTGSVISSRYKTIYVPAFENKIDYMNTDSRKLYIPQLETSVHDAIVSRYLFDGNLRVAEVGNTDLVLKGRLVSFDREELRMNETNDVKEYRLRITVGITLWDPVNEKPVWDEPSFSGEATYYTSGPLAKSEAAAIQDALTDLARRVVARTIEDW